MLISIDGMHAVDFINCSTGGYCPNLNVIMLLPNPSFQPRTVTTAVQTAQIAPTILAALGLDPNLLDAVQAEGTAVLPEGWMQLAR